MLTPSFFQVMLKTSTRFQMLAVLYKGAVFYQNDIKHVKPYTKSADIFLQIREKEDELEKNG